MKKTRFTEEQMVTILREADQRLAPEASSSCGGVLRALGLRYAGP